MSVERLYIGRIHDQLLVSSSVMPMVNCQRSIDSSRIISRSIGNRSVSFVQLVDEELKLHIPLMWSQSCISDRSAVVESKSIVG